MRFLYFFMARDGPPVPLGTPVACQCQEFLLEFRDRAGADFGWGSKTDKKESGAAQVGLSSSSLPAAGALGSWPALGGKPAISTTLHTKMGAIGMR